MPTSTPLDPEELDQRVRSNLPAMQRLAVRLCGNVTEAEDVVADALLSIARRWRSFAGESAFETWVHAIVVNAFRDQLRRKRRDRDRLRELRPPDAAQPIEPADADDLGRHVASCVGRLPRRQREVAVLVLLEELPPTEAALALDLTPQNVRVHLHHARQKLQDMLRPLLDDSPVRKASSKAPVQ